MTEEQYLEFLKTAPEHDSDEFLRFLIDNNVVVWHFEDWLVIENKKYHNDQTEWHTAFWFGKRATQTLILCIQSTRTMSG